MIPKINIPSNQGYNEKEGSFENRYYSVEFTPHEFAPFYQFKLRNSETMTLFVLIKEDSEILKKLEIGQVLKMKYYSEDISCLPEYRTTQINHISADKDGRYKGHCMVGLSILPTHHH